MRRPIALLAAAGLWGAASLWGAAGQAQEPGGPRRAAADAARAERVRAALAGRGFRGIYALAQNGRRLGGGVIGDAVPYEAAFPLASFTGQVLAVMAMQQVEAGRVALDAPVSRYLPPPGTGRRMVPGTGGRTVRQMLAQMPGGQAQDAVLVALLERVTRRPVAELYAERVAGPTGMGALFQASTGDTRADANWPNGPTPAERAAATGTLVGTAEDVLAFDAGLLDGRLLGPRLRGELLRVRSTSVAGCPAPVVEQAGRAGRFRLWNMILPQSATAAVLLTADQGVDAGAGREALSAACGKGDGT